MKVRKSVDSRRKLVRWLIDAVTEHRNGDLPKRYYRTDADGKPFATKNQAEKHVRELIDNMRTGTNPDDVRAKTFGDALDRYHTDLDRKQADGAGTALHYDAVRARLATYVEALTLRGVEIRKVRLSTIDVDLIEKDLEPQLRDARFTKNFSRILLQDLRITFAHAIDVDWIVTNPTRKVTIGSIKTKARERSGIDPLAREVYQRLLKSFSLHLDWVRRLDPSAELPIELAAKTGVRAGELLAISSNKIGHNTRQLTVDQAWKKVARRQPKVLGQTKTHETRVIGLSTDLIARLSEYQLANGVAQDASLFGTTDHAPWRRAWQRAQFAVNGWLLVYSGSKTKSYRLFELTGNETDVEIAKLRTWSDGQNSAEKHARRSDGQVFETLAEAAEHAGVTLLTWHDLRHLYCSVLFATGLPIERITALMGHSSDKVTRNHYKEWITDPVRDADEADIVAAAYG